MAENQELLKRFGLHLAAKPEPDQDESDVDDDGCSVFGYLRGTKERAMMLEFRLRNGNRFAFPYSWLGMTTFDPSQGITMKFVGDVTYLVTVTGSNLNSAANGRITLFHQGLLRHRVLWLREMDKAELLGNKDKIAMIDAIIIERQDEVSH